jgi:DNA-directed RNA polymerase specialized sigma24 family protein
MTETQKAEVERLLPYIRRIVRTFGPDDELVSEGYLIACQVIPKWRPERGPLDQFVGLCVRHRMIRLRERAHRAPRTFADGDMNDADPAAPPPRSCGLYDAIGRIPDESLRKLAELKWIGKMTLRELAGDYGVSIDAIRKRLATARAEVARLMADSVPQS